jgi:hypothetical protein
MTWITRVLRMTYFFLGDGENEHEGIYLCESFSYRLGG